MGVCFRVSPCPSIASHAMRRSQPFCTPSPADPVFGSTKVSPETLDYPCPLTGQYLIFFPHPLPDPNHVFVLWNYFSGVTQ